MPTMLIGWNNVWRSYEFKIDKIDSDTSTKNPTLQCVNTASFSLRMFCVVFKSTKKIKQTTKNYCLHFCWQLDKLKHLSHEVFEHLNWLTLTDWNNVFLNWLNWLTLTDWNNVFLNWLTKTYRLKQCIFKYFNK